MNIGDENDFQIFGPKLNQYEQFSPMNFELWVAITRQNVTWVKN